MIFGLNCVLGCVKPAAVRPESFGPVVNSGPVRALHTWQIKLVWWTSSLMTCSSPKPISRKRLVTSGGAESSLMRTCIPVRTRLSGQVEGVGQRGGASDAAAASHGIVSVKVFIVYSVREPTYKQRRLRETSTFLAILKPFFDHWWQNPKCSVAASNLHKKCRTTRNPRVVDLSALNDALANMKSAKSVENRGSANAGRRLA